MTLASLVLVIIIRDIREIRGQILQPRISRIIRMMETEHLRSSFQRLRLIPRDRISQRCQTMGWRSKRTGRAPVVDENDDSDMIIINDLPIDRIAAAC